MDTERMWLESLAAPDFTGVAPEVSFVDVKVIGADGFGSTSSLIRSIDWVLVGDSLDILIANISVGHPPTETHLDDFLGSHSGMGEPPRL